MHLRWYALLSEKLKSTRIIFSRNIFIYDFQKSKKYIFVSEIVLFCFSLHDLSLGAWDIPALDFSKS